MESKIRTNEFHAIQTNMSALVRKEKFEDKEMLAVPTILIVEGVHNKILYPKEEISKFPDAWNGRPVPIVHPTDPRTGQHISANSPKIKEKRVAGELYNTKFEDGKLKSESWLDPVKLQKIDPSVLTKLEKDQMLEVSTGMFMDYEETPGVWNGEEYIAIARNIRPDHLAILPTTEGACSIRDGAGMPRVNEQEEEPSKLAKIKEFFSKGLSLFTEAEDVIANIEKEIKVKPVTNQDNNKEKVKPTNNKGENPMENDRKKRVDALIANEKSAFSEDDRTMLEALEDDQLQKIEGMIPKEEASKEEPAKKEEAEKPAEKPVVNKEEKPAEKPVVNKEEKPAEKEEPKAVTFDDLIANASPEQKDMVESGIALAKEKRSALVEGILKTNSGFTKEELEGKNLSELEKLGNLAKVKSDFTANAGNAGSITSNEEDMKPMEAPRMTPKKQD